jgi:Ala-tRNA(Pro) deacylase
LAAINDEARKVKIALDKQLLKASVINCHPLTNRRTTSLTKEALDDFLASTGHGPLYVSLQEDGENEP